MTVIFSTVFTLLSQYFSTGTIDWGSALLSIIVVGVIGFLVVYFVPIAKWGGMLAGFMHMKSNSFGSGVVISFLFSVIMVIVMSPAGAIFGMTIMGGLPISEPLKVCYIGWWMYLLIGWGLAVLVSNPLMKLSMKLCKAAPLVHE